MKYALIASFLSAATTLVSAHGYVEKAVIAGTTYSGYEPYYDPYVSPSRQLIFREIQGNGPVEDLSLIDVQCGGYTAGGISGSKPAALSATVPAGSEISLTWTLWPDSHKGPLLTYMVRCPGDCSTWLPGTAAVWFKVKHDGKNAAGVWATTPYETSPVPAYKFSIPASLAPGNYIARHEILALHGAWAYPGIQSYPSCFQVTVTGSGTQIPSGSSLVSFPGAYQPGTPGIVFDMYTNSPVYPIPGPPVWPSEGGSATSVAPPPSPTLATSTTKPASSTLTSKATTTTTVAPVVTSNTKAATTTSAPAASGTPVAKYGQCGGIGWTGSTVCVTGSTCVKANDYYSQCQ